MSSVFLQHVGVVHPRKPWCLPFHLTISTALPAFAAHKGTTVEEVYTPPGKWNSHLSDDVAAFALAHNSANRQARPAAGEGVPKTSYVSRSQRELTDGSGERALLAVGEVRTQIGQIRTRWNRSS